MNDIEVFPERSISGQILDDEHSEESSQPGDQPKTGRGRVKRKKGEGRHKGIKETIPSSTFDEPHTVYLPKDGRANMDIDSQLGLTHAQRSFRRRFWRRG